MASASGAWIPAVHVLYRVVLGFSKFETCLLVLLTDQRAGERAVNPNSFRRHNTVKRLTSLSVLALILRDIVAAVSKGSLVT